MREEPGKSVGGTGSNGQASASKDMSNARLAALLSRRRDDSRSYPIHTTSQTDATGSNSRASLNISKRSAAATAVAGVALAMALTAVTPVLSVAAAEVMPPASTVELTAEQVWIKCGPTCWCMRAW